MDIQKALDAGYTHKEIADFLDREGGYNVSGARRAGDGDEQIVNAFRDGGAPDLGNAAIDDRTGASWLNRAVIGAAADDAGKLARTRALYGDSARMEKDGRISFVDPDTKRRTYVNPSGFDMGDLAGGAREIGSALAAIPAGVAGFFGAGPAGTALASSAAGAAAGQGIDALAAYYARQQAEKNGYAVPQMQSPGDALKEAAVETAAGTLGGTALGYGAKAIGSALNPMKQEVVKAFRELNNMPIRTVGSAAGKGGAQYESFLGNLPLSTGIMENARIQTGKDLYDAARRVITDYGGRATPFLDQAELGQFAKDAAARSKTAFQQQSDKTFGTIFGQHGQSPAALSATEKAIDDMTKNLSPTVREANKRRLQAILSSELKDNADGTLNIDTLKTARTKVGYLRDNYSPQIADTGAVQEKELKELYNALTDDIGDALYKSGGKEARTAWEEGNKAYAAQKAARKTASEKIFGAKKDLSATDVGKKLLRNDLDADTVNALKTILSEDDFKAIAGGMLENAGRPLASAGETPDFMSAFTLARNIGSGRGAIPQSTQQALWGHIPQEKMDALRAVSNNLAQNSRNANTSNTAQNIMSMGTLKGLWDIPQDIFNGNWLSGLSNFGLSLSMPLGAKLTTNPGIIGYLARPQSSASKWLIQNAPLAGVEGGLLGVLAGRD